jgi:hypothetical protein
MIAGRSAAPRIAVWVALLRRARSCWRQPSPESASVEGAGVRGQVMRTVPTAETATEPTVLPVWLAVTAALSR